MKETIPGATVRSDAPREMQHPDRKEAEMQRTVRCHAERGRLSVAP